jgi:hypothetical protein
MQEKILDLKVFEKETLSVKLPDGRMLRLMKPTRKMATALIGLAELQDEGDPERVMLTLDAITMMLLRNNDSGACITESDVTKLNLPMKLELISSFKSWIREIETRPNS